MNIPGLDTGRQRLINAFAARQKNILQPETDYRKLLLNLLNEQRLKNIALQGKKSAASRKLTKKKFEFEKETGQLSLKDIEKLATADMWNTIITGLGSVAGSYLQNKAMQDYTWKNYLLYSGLEQSSYEPLQELNPGIAPSWWGPRIPNPRWER